MGELRTILTKYSSERLANIITFELTNTGKVNLLDAPKELLDEIKHIESIKATWDSGILRMEVVQMLFILLKIICLVVVGMWLSLMVEMFKIDYNAGDRKRLFWDGAIILCFVTNGIMLLMWT